MEKQGVYREFSGEVIRYFASFGADSDYGARPLKRAMQKHLEDYLADCILTGQLTEGDTRKIILKNDKISLEKNWQNDKNGVWYKIEKI